MGLSLPEGGPSLLSRAQGLPQGTGGQVEVVLPHFTPHSLREWALKAVAGSLPGMSLAELRISLSLTPSGTPGPPAA